ncbi:hypothetical protein AAFC00_003578 [Neodothiora populina]|uniref:Carboxylic ester hydrolase n=1 Tax=Neodothiora populina TaxID=2781224 RepID=A0ABR3PFS2_9PEZI
MLFSSISSVYLFLQIAVALNPLAQLSYATYRGTALPNGITQFLGLRFAAPPVGNLRFAAPKDPLIEYSIVEADTHGPLCLATGGGPPTDANQEDCLFLDVYAPSNATELSALPVYFFIQGGGFNGLSNPNLNGSGLITASGCNIVIVTINYRVGVYGFLAGEELAKAGSYNNGLKDQRKALEWIQKHISKFGGNPNHVVVGGDSAGAASINLQLTAYGGRDDKLFHATAAESQSFAAVRSVSESQYQYDSLVIKTGCISANDTLACLRGVNATIMQQQSYPFAFPGASAAPLYMWGPTLDNDFIKELTYAAYADGKFVQLPAIYGDVTNEGTIFAYRNTSSIAESDGFLKNQFPWFTLKQLAKVNSLYPLAEQFNGSGAYWRQLSNAYGEIRYICPGIFISGIYAKLGIKNNYNYHWDVIDPTSEASGLGVTHTVELNAIWGPQYTKAAPASYNTTNAAIGPVVQAYWTSFIRSFDPNTYRLPGTPSWDAWTKNDSYQRLYFQTNNTHMEAVPADQQDRCKYLSSIGVALRQ